MKIAIGDTGNLRAGWITRIMSVIILFSYHLFAGSDSRSRLKEVEVLSSMLTLEADLGVSIEVCVCDAGPGNSCNKTRLSLSGQVGFLLNCHKVHMAGGVEPEIIFSV